MHTIFFHHHYQVYLNFHKNTLKYKLAKIREILGYDITINENRMNIMLAFRIRKLDS